MSTIRAELPRLALRRGPTAAAVLHVVARMVVIGGLVLAGFIAYQFGVTSFIANRGQSTLQDRLITAPARTDVIAYTPESRPPAPIAATGFADVPPLEEDPAAPPSLIVETAPATGDPVGRIVIPAAGVDWLFVEGVDRGSLRAGVGHMTGTPVPGQPGNAVLSGHRTTFGAPFLHLDRLAAGDAITVETQAGTHRYEVVAVEIVAPDEVWVTGQWDGAWLTLTTCHPVFSSRERLVVIARLVEGPNAAAILGAA